ncbi:hypothetical protein MNBD_BACTEROID01-177 [hydrothermal vent metagenome]|uniref:Uncharacterized protein n=1 Tax=hydrothermal vent metagenome TaxID=652676 RepID=A0A3B0TZZ4_9ZZZZ
MNFKEKYAHKRLKKKAQRVGRKVELFDFTEAKKIGILWHIDDKQGFSYITQYLKSRGLDFTSLCYTGETKENGLSQFDNKGLNWLGFPKSGIAKTFINTEFGLLMNISAVNSFPLQVVTALSRAKFKCGWTNSPDNYFDLLIDVGKNTDSVYLIKQQLFYIKQLTINSK